MGKLTRGRDGRLYNGKGTKGGRAKPIASPPQLSSPALPTKAQKATIAPEAIKPDMLVMKHPLADNPKLEVPPPPEALVDILDEISEDYAEIEFPNHNADYEDDWLSMEELISDNAYYRNNCDAVSSEMSEYIYMNYYSEEGITDITPVQLQYKSAVHVAVGLKVDGSPWVIDYTARQFDEKAPCPLVLPQQKWEALIDYYVWTQFSDTRTDSKN